MKRLTTDRTKIFARESVTLNSISKKELRKLYNEVFDRLQVYEDAEEAGTLVRLPCKVGDTVYKTCTVNARIAIGSMWDGRIVKTNCDRCGYRGCGCVDIGLRRHECDTMIDIINPITVKHLEYIIRIMPYINKHYFLTREEAEAALKARDGE